LVVENLLVGGYPFIGGEVVQGGGGVKQRGGNSLLPDRDRVRERVSIGVQPFLVDQKRFCYMGEKKESVGKKDPGLRKRGQSAERNELGCHSAKS